MLKCIDKGELSVLILPPLISLLKKDDFFDTYSFKEYVWPHIARLCKAEELPAQGLYLLVENSEMFYKYVNAGDFQSHFLPLILKSLDCGVHKLQHLGMTKIPFLSK